MHDITLDGQALADLFPTTFSAQPPECAAFIDLDRQSLHRRLKHLAGRARCRTIDSTPGVELLRRRGFHERNIVPYAHTPFDTRWLYLGSPSDYTLQAAAGSSWIVIAQEGPTFVRRLVLRDGGPRLLLPIYTVRSEPGAAPGFLTKTPNLTREARQFLLRLGAGETELFHHAVAMLAGRGEARERTPLPRSREKLAESALLGYRVCRLFGPDEKALAPALEPELRLLGVPARTGREARMLRGNALQIDEHWLADSRIAVRDYSGEELLAVGDFARSNGLTADHALELLGEQTCDVYLNDKAFWRNVPMNVWNFTSAGATPLRAWIAARTISGLGRPLSRDEAGYFASVIRRIAALLLLEPALRQNAQSMEMHRIDSPARLDFFRPLPHSDRDRRQRFER
jgi:hypothetical protein